MLARFKVNNNNNNRAYFWHTVKNTGTMTWAHSFQHNRQSECWHRTLLQTRIEYLPRPRVGPDTLQCLGSCFNRVACWLVFGQHLSPKAHRKWRFSWGFVLQKSEHFHKSGGKKRRSISIHFYSCLRCCETTWGSGGQMHHKVFNSVLHKYIESHTIWEMWMWVVNYKSCPRPR